MSLRSRSLHFRNFNVTFPDERIVQVTLNRPDKLNCIDKVTSREIAEIWEHFDQDESLWVAVITGTGRAFCTGADLHEWNDMNKKGVINDMAAPGLAGLPRRSGKKPIIAAVNGICMGGGFEMVANCDVVVASSKAVFSLPEVKRGIVPVAGCLPRLTRTLGLQRTMYLALTGRSVNAQTLSEWGLVSQVVRDESESETGSGSGSASSADHVVQAALQIAKDMCKNSPDALIVGRMGVRMSWELGSVEEATSTLNNEWYPRLVEGPNFAEGIQAFVEKRPTTWVNSKL